MEPVRNHRNPAVVEAARLHRARHRREAGETLIEGPHLLAEALAANAVVKDIFAVEGDSAASEIAGESGIPIAIVTDRALERLAGTENPRGPVAVVEIPTPVGIGRQHCIVSWGVSDPGNVGNMIRVAATFGWDFAFAPGTADPWSPKVLRTAAGNQFRVAMSEVQSIDDLENLSYSPVATVVSGGSSPESLGPGHWALLIGDEGAGLPPEIISACKRTLTLPMPGGAESLNASVATGIIVYAVSKHAGDSTRIV